MSSSEKKHVKQTLQQGRYDNLHAKFEHHMLFSDTMDRLAWQDKSCAKDIYELY